MVENESNSLKEPSQETVKTSRFESLRVFVRSKQFTNWLPVILLAIALPITVFVAMKQQSFRNFAATNENTALTPTITQKEQISSITPDEDAYVSADLPKNNFGDSSRLYVKGPRKFISFLKFDLRPYLGKTINKATMRVKVYNSSLAASNAVQKLEEVDSLWIEKDINFNNMPTLGAMVATFTAGEKASFFDIDVTNWVKSHGGNVSSLAIENTSSDELILYSKESLIGKPTLTITYQ